jgi:anti-sigma regulatory factor (Ser/Thr protein kinase)
VQRDLVLIVRFGVRAEYSRDVTQTVASRPVPEGETWARSALAQLADVPFAYRAGLALAEGGGRRLLFTASDRDGASSVPWCEIDAYADVPLTHTARTGETVLGSLEELAVRYAEFAERQRPETWSIASVPIFAAGHVMGGYVLYFDTVQAFDRAQVENLEELGATLGAELRDIQLVTPRAGGSLEAEPVPAGAHATTWLVAPEPRAVPDARHFASRTLTEWGVDQARVNNALLCLNELVTNAIIHTSAGCELRLVLDQDVLTTSVRDAGSHVVVDASRVRQDPLAVHGRGLQLVDAFSSRWGSTLDAGGMTVWFVLEP